MIVFYSLMMLLTMNGRIGRKIELEEGLRMAMREILSEFQKAESSKQSEVKKAMEERIRSYVDSDSKVKVVDVRMDENATIMQVEVEEIFRYPNGKRGEIRVSETAIVE